MSIGTLIFLLFIGGSLFAMVAMHRGGSHGMGMGMGCGGGHRRSSADDDRSEMRHSDGVAMTDDPVQGAEPDESAHTGGRRGGC